MPVSLLVTNSLAYVGVTVVTIATSKSASSLCSRSPASLHAPLSFCIPPRLRTPPSCIVPPARHFEGPSRSALPTPPCFGLPPPAVGSRMPRTQARPLVEHLLCVGHATPLTELPPSPDHPPSPPAAPGFAPAARLLRSKFAPALLSSHPASRPFLPGPNAACSFCLPSGLRLALGRRPPPSFGCFVLTDDGYNRLYGHTLTVYVSVPADTAVHTLPLAGATAAPPPAAVGASSRAGATPPAGDTGGGLRRDTGGGPRQEALRQLYSEEHYVSLGAGACPFESLPTAFFPSPHPHPAAAAAG